jgi:hypothetical protein
MQWHRATHCHSGVRIHQWLQKSHRHNGRLHRRFCGRDLFVGVRDESSL